MQNFWWVAWILFLSYSFVYFHAHIRLKWTALEADYCTVYKSCLVKVLFYSYTRLKCQQNAEQCTTVQFIMQLFLWRKVWVALKSPCNCVVYGSFSFSAGIAVKQIIAILMPDFQYYNLLAVPKIVVMATLLTVSVNCRAMVSLFYCWFVCVSVLLVTFLQHKCGCVELTVTWRH